MRVRLWLIVADGNGIMTGRERLRVVAVKLWLVVRCFGCLWLVVVGHWWLQDLIMPL